MACGVNYGEEDMTSKRKSSIHRTPLTAQEVTGIPKPQVTFKRIVCEKCHQSGTLYKVAEGRYVCGKCIRA